MLPSTTWVGVSFGAVSRARGGSALLRSQYQAAAGSTRSMIPHLAGGEIEDRFGPWLLLPEGSPAWAHDRVTLWTRAAQAERRCDAQEARYLDVTWPRDLPFSAIADAVELLFGRFRRDGLAVQVDLHIEEARDGLPNPHLHAQIATRALGQDGFSAHKDRGLSDWFHSVGGRAARRHVADVFNALAFEHGIALTFDPRPNRERDLPVAEDRLPRSFTRRPDTLAARDLLARQDRQRDLRHEHREAHEACVATKLEVAGLERQRRTTLDMLPCATDPRAPVKAPLAHEDWERWRRSVPLLSLAPPVSLDDDGIALPVGTRAIVDTGDSIRIEGDLDNDAGLALLALADWKGWRETRLETETAPTWFTPSASKGPAAAALPTTMGALSWEGVEAIASTWRARTPGSGEGRRIVTEPSSRVTQELEMRLAVARLPGSGKPRRTDVVGLMHGAVRSEPPGSASWELWKARLDLALLVLGRPFDHVHKRRTACLPEQTLHAQADPPDEHDLSTAPGLF